MSTVKYVEINTVEDLLNTRVCAQLLGMEWELCDLAFQKSINTERLNEEKKQQ